MGKGTAPEIVSRKKQDISPETVKDFGPGIEKAEMTGRLENCGAPEKRNTGKKQTMGMTMREIAVRLYGKYRNLVLYGVIGGLSVIFDFIVFFLLTIFFPEYYLLANVISVNCGIINSFLLNRRFNFKVKDRFILRFIVFYLVGMTGLLISSGMLYLLVGCGEMNLLASKAVTIFVVTVFQFILNKNVTFRQHG